MRQSGTVVGGGEVAKSGWDPWKSGWETETSGSIGSRM